MDTLQAIRERRAVKHYDPAYEMSAEEQQQLLNLAIQSPTSFNIQHWRIVNVQDKALRAKIREAAWDQAQITDASMLLVMCGDIKAWNKSPERYWQDAPQEAQDILVPMIKPFYEGKEQLARDEAMRSMGIAAQTIMLAAKGMGYDSCPMIGFDEGRVEELIKLPKDHTIGLIITVGKALKPAWPKPGQLPLKDIVITDQFAA